MNAQVHFRNKLASWFMLKETVLAIGVLAGAMFAAFACVLPASAAPLTLPPGQTISVNTNFQGGSWSGTTNLTVNAGVTATLDNGNTLTYTANSGSQLTGGGTLANNGIFNHNFGGYLHLLNNTTFDNNTLGVLNLNAVGSRIHMNGGANGNFRNLGGIINVNAASTLFDSAGLFTTFDGTTLHNLNLNVTTGNFTVQAPKAGGQVRLNTLNIPSGSFVTFDTPSVFTHSSAGDINFNQAGRVNFGSFTMGTNVILNNGQNSGFVGGTVANNGFNMTLETGRTATMTGNVSTFSGNGTFLNKSTSIVNLNMNAGQYWHVHSGAKFDNLGVLNMTGPGSRIHLNGGANGTVRNFGGTINVSTANAWIDGSGTFTTFDGTTLHDLNLNITSGDFLLQTSGAGQVRLNLPGVPTGSFVTFNTPSTFTRTGGGDLNFNYAGKVNLGSFGMGTNVILDSVQNHTFVGGAIANNGFNMTLEPGRTVTMIGNVASFSGNGTFLNKSTSAVNLNMNAGQYLHVHSGAKFDNLGTLNMNGPGARIHLNGGANGSVRNFGGTINVSAANSWIDGAGMFTTFDGTTLHDLNLNVTGGDFLLQTAGAGQVRLNLPSVPTGSAVAFDTPSTFTKTGGGDLNFNYAGAVHLGSFGMGTNVILDSVGNHSFRAGTITNNGFNLTLETGRTANSTGNVNAISGTGSFFNKGTITQNINSGQYYLINSGAKLVNTGTYSFNTNNSRIHLNGGANGTFNNLSGTLTKLPGIAYAFIDGTAGTFMNTGTILVPGGELEIQSMAFPQFSAGTITAGTYTVDSTLTGSALLDLQPANAGISIIGTNATVNLIGTGASLQQLTSTFNTLNGKLKLSENKVLNLNNLTMASTSQLTFGLDDLGPNSKINLTGNLSANGLINIEDLGGLEIGVYDLISVGGMFTNNGLALGTLPGGYNGEIFNVSLLLPANGSFGGIVQLSIELVPAPEPGSATLLGLGLLGAACLRRRRRVAVVA